MRTRRYDDLARLERLKPGRHGGKPRQVVFGKFITQLKKAREVAA